MQYYNSHAHVFTMKNAPENFLSLYLPKPVARLIDTATNTAAGVSAFSWLLKRLGNGAARYASFLQIGKSTDEIDVFEQLRSNYADSSFKFTALTLFMEDCGALSSQSGYEGQLAGVLDIKKKYPDNCLVFLGIDPRWKGSAKELRKTVEEKFNYRLSTGSGRTVFPYVGLKLYPSTGFFAFDKNLTETFEWAADNGVPVISHCNYLGGIYNNDANGLKKSLQAFDPYTGKKYQGPVYQDEFVRWRYWFGINAARNNKRSCSYFLEPESYRSMVSYFHVKRQLFNTYSDQWYQSYRKSLTQLAGNQRLPLKLCLAHFGGDDQVMAEYAPNQNATPVGVNSKNWCGQIKDLMLEFDHLYTDISYTLSNQKVKGHLLKAIADSRIGDRILFGTDFFLTERVMPEKSDVDGFELAAQNQPDQSPGGTNAWDLIASRNPARFLLSKFYDGSVI